MVQALDKHMPELQYILPAGRQKLNIIPVPEYHCWKAAIVSVDIAFSKQISI